MNAAAPWFTLASDHAPQGRVLLLDAQWNKSVAAIRSLRRRGLEVHAGETTWLAAGMFSRYVSKRFTYPSPLLRPEDFLAAVDRRLSQYTYDALIPMELATLLLLSEHREMIAGRAAFPFALHDVLLRAARKWGAYEAARDAGAPVPHTVFLPAGRADSDLPLIVKRLGLPLVLKPDLGEGGRGLYVCNNQEELRTALDRIAASGKDHVAQQFVPHGGAFGVSILCVEPGRVDATFTHRRLREHPPDGGPSTLRESVRHPQAEQAARDIAAALKWQGVAMLEFRIDPRDGQAKLLEINPRFWGSLPLAIAAGVDFPYLLYKAALGLPAGPAPVQTEGVRVRNLLPGDLLHLIARRGRVGLDFFNPFHARDELISLRDPGPVIGRIVSAAGLLFDPQLRALLQNRQSSKSSRTP